MERRKVAGALLLSVVLMLVGGVFSVVRAAPTGQGEAKMSIGIAFVVGVLYYASLSPFFANLGFTVLYRPLVAGTLVGLVMGRPVEGMAIGANINVLYLGWLSAGGSLPGDPGLAGYLGTALALGGGLGADAALADRQALPPGQVRLILLPCSMMSERPVFGFCLHFNADSCIIRIQIHD